MTKYSPPWTGLDRSEFLRLDLNENTSPLPLHVKDALKAYIDSEKLQMYPSYSDFMQVLAQYVGVEEEVLMLTNGSDQAIEVILRSFLDDGDTMVMAQPGFPIFGQVAATIGANVKAVPYPETFVFPEDAFLQAITPDVKLVVIINPDNPTGVSVSESVIKRILSENPDIPVIVDEAYFEFTGVTSIDLLSSFPNLIVTRTFSKSFAMAGLRLGYLAAHPDLIAEFAKVRGPFDINSCGLIAAESQINNQEIWKAYVDELMNSSKPLLEDFFKKKKVRFIPGAAHFMLVAPKLRDEAVNYLRENGILVRPMIPPLIKDMFRMNLGTLSQTKRFIEVYGSYLVEFEGE